MWSCSISTMSSLSARRMRSPLVGPYFLAYALREILTLMRGGPVFDRCGGSPRVWRLFRGSVAVSLRAAAFQAHLAGVGIVEPAFDQGIEAVDRAGAGVGDELDLLDLARLEADGGPAGQV